MKRKFLTKCGTAIVLLGTFGMAQAHGDAPHKAASAYSESDFEQMAWGIGALPAKVQRTIKISLSDNMRFDPSSVNVRKGETVRFVVKNDGVMLHEFVIGTLKANQEHAELMKRFPNMQHDAPYMAHVAPGETGEVIWKFNRTGEFQFACLIAGHYDAGMFGTIKVAETSGVGK